MEELPVAGDEKSDIKLAEMKKQEKEALKRRKHLESKIEQGRTTMEKIEGRSISEFLTSKPTRHVLMVYFGVGSQSDCDVIEKFLENSGYEENMMDIFPGFPHAFLEFESHENAQKLMGQLGKTSYKDLDTYSVELPFKQKTKTAFLFYCQFAKSELNNKMSNELPNATTPMNIPGMMLIENFITEDEEKELFEIFDKREWHNLSNRRVQHDGYEFIYGSNNVNPNNKLGPLPDWIRPTQTNLEAYTDKINGAGVGLDQLTVNDYSPGDGIPPHVDAISPFEEAFAAVSMGTGSVMNFRHPDGRQVNVYYPPRSAVIFTGEGRLVWQHSIPCHKMDRVNGKIVEYVHSEIQRPQGVTYFQESQRIKRWTEA